MFFSLKSKLPVRAVSARCLPLLWALCAASACGPDHGAGTLHSDTPSSNGPGVPDLSTLPEWDGGFTNECGVQNFMLAPGLPPEVMIVLDRSGSMSSAFDNGTRWSKVADAVKSAVASLQGIGWGLAVFPVDNDCGTSAAVDVDIASNNGPAIAAKIDSYAPGGNTPTAEAVKKATANLAARTTANPKYLLLASDGEPNCTSLSVTCTCIIGSPNAQGQCCLGPLCNFGMCIPLPGGGDGVAAAEQAVKDAANQGVHTFVIGVAADGTAASALNTLATAGLEPRPMDPKFFPAGSQADLVTAVNTIAGQIISCSFALSSPPPSDLGLVEVSLNGAQLMRDTTHAGGWDFGPGNNSILFYGASCTTLKGSTSAAVKAVYKCPPTL